MLVPGAGDPGSRYHPAMWKSLNLHLFIPSKVLKPYFRPYPDPSSALLLKPVYWIARKGEAEPVSSQ